MPKKLLVCVGLLALFIGVMNICFAPNNILSWDVFGYYLYLPTTFIYGDLAMVKDQVIFDLIDQYHSSATFYQAMKLPDGQYVMKYSMGMAILFAPFFFIGWLMAWMFEFPIDGFSSPFQWAIFYGSMLYTLLGLWFLAKILNRFFTWKVSALTLVLVVLSTNYLVHVTMYGQNAMSQNYLFTAYTLIIWLTIRWHESFKWKYAFGLGLVLSLTLLSRPTEIVALLIPVFWGVYNKESLMTKWQLLMRNKTHVLTIVLLLVGFGSLQLGYWKLITGQFLYNSYGGNAGEGLDLLSPYTYDFLFSFRKGWLIYTPIMTLALWGFWSLYKRNKSIFYSLFGYFVFNLYLVSSWSNWWYAQSFSQRAMVSSYPIMAILLGYFLLSLSDQKKGIKIWGAVGIVIFLTLNVFQTIQYHKGVIHGDRMTQAYYCATFGKLTTTEADRKLLLVNRNFEGDDAMQDTAAYKLWVLDELDFNQQMDTLAYAGLGSFLMSDTQIYSPVIEATYHELTSKDHVWIKVSAMVYPSAEDIENPFSLVVHFTHKDYPYHYKTIESKDMDLAPGEWNKIEMTYLSPEVRTEKDKLRTMIWYRGIRQLRVDDFKVEIFEPKR